MNDDETKNETEIAENEAEQQAEQDAAAACAEEDQQEPPKESDDPEFDLEGADRLAELESQVEELTDKLLRAVAETENVRRRTGREKEDASKYAIAGFASDMVSVADNLTRALGSVDGETRTANEAVETLMAGVEMT
ncbi:MAG TPA: nucleotide exchange factor GrpE, partial [Rhodospirillales bacterium]|nr:nucleotide exchange factor GrpE [Rhodospirillales bacterium]